MNKKLVCLVLLAILAAAVVGEGVRPFSTVTALIQKGWKSLGNQDGNWTKAHTVIKVEPVQIALDFFSVEGMPATERVTIINADNPAWTPILGKAIDLYQFGWFGLTNATVRLETNYTDVTTHTEYQGRQGIYESWDTLGGFSMNKSFSLGHITYRIFDRTYTSSEILVPEHAWLYRTCRGDCSTSIAILTVQISMPVHTTVRILGSSIIHNLVVNSQSEFAYNFRIPSLNRTMLATDQGLDVELKNAHMPFENETFHTVILLLTPFEYEQLRNTGHNEFLLFIAGPALIANMTNWDTIECFRKPYLTTTMDGAMCPRNLAEPMSNQPVRMSGPALLLAPGDYVLVITNSANTPMWLDVSIQVSGINWWVQK